jgi:transcriptional regulator with XRE-family HTH domain
MTLEQTAERIAAHPKSVNNWEAGRTRPSLRHLGRVIEFLGYDPRPVAETLGEQLRRHRQGLGCSQGEAARTLGVSPSVLSWWETSRRKPRGRYLEKVHAFLDDDPRPTPTTIGEQLKRHREQLGLTLTAMARRLGVVQSTLCRWEAGEREPQDRHLLMVEQLLAEDGADSLS